VHTDPAELSSQPTISPIGEASSDGWWYDNTTSVQLTAQPVSGYDFLYWDVDGLSQGVNVTITVPMDAPHTATAHYQAAAPPPPPAVGGYAAPIIIAAEAPSLASQIGLAFAFLVAMAVTILLIKRRSKKLKLESKR
jgi:hypothetical protein